MQLPKFSIVIPNYNHATHLEEAIVSVLSQEYESKELIVMDAGSTDGSVEIIKKYADKIFYWASEKDRGTYEANNKGLKKITGDYWCILNSDDLLLPGALSTVAGLIHQQGNLKWISGGVEVIDASKSVTGEILPKVPTPIEGFTFLNGCWIPHPSTFIHREVIDSVGLFNNWHEMDFDYWLRMEAKGYFPFTTNEKLAAFRIHENSKSYETINFYKEALSIIETFVSAMNIAETPGVRKRIKRSQVQLKRLEVCDHLINNNRAAALLKLIVFGLSFPEIIRSRWYAGLLRRVFTGLLPHDPIYNVIMNRNESGKWNTEK